MIALAAAAALLVGGMGSPSAAPAVTPGEFDEVARGMTKHRAEVIFDTSGRRTGFFREGSAVRCAMGNLGHCAAQSRIYPTESPGGWVKVDYVRTSDGRWRACFKMASWGSE